MPLYLHEDVDCVAGRVSEYVEAIGTTLIPLTDERRLRCCGFFQVSGSSGRWPQLVALWEMEVSDHVEQRKSIAAHEGMRRWMTEGARFRTGGFDRILILHHFSPRPVARPQRQRPGAICLEQTFRVRPGATRDFLGAVQQQLLPRAPQAELTLEGFWRSQFRPLEHLALWSVPDWEAYGRLLQRRDAADEGSNVPGLDDLWPWLADLSERILIPLPFSPLGGSETTSFAYQA